MTTLNCEIEIIESLSINGILCDHIRFSDATREHFKGSRVIPESFWLAHSPSGNVFDDGTGDTPEAAVKRMKEKCGGA